MAYESTIRFRCRTELVQAVSDAAAAAGMDPSAWLRLTVEAALQRPEHTRAQAQRLDTLLQDLLDTANEAQVIADGLVERHLGIAPW